MKTILIILLTIVSLTDLRAQQILIEQPYNGSTSYGRHAISVDSISELPSQIRTALEGYFTGMFGCISQGLSFSHGQRIDQKGYFSELRNEAFEMQWLVPAYDLNFILSDSTLGIKCYYVQLRLDEYGQLLKSNWPRKGFSDKAKFQSRNEISNFALEQARIRGFRTSKFSTDLEYCTELESLNWVFKFPVSKSNENTDYDILEINLTSLKVVDEYTRTTSTVY